MYNVGDTLIFPNGVNPDIEYTITEVNKTEAGYVIRWFSPRTNEWHTQFYDHRDLLRLLSREDIIINQKSLLPEDLFTI